MNTYRQQWRQVSPRNSRFVVFLLFFYALIAPSPIWPAIGIRGFILLTLVFGALLVYLLLTRRNLEIRFITGAVIVFTFALVPALYWSAPILAIYPMFFVSSALLVSCSDNAERDRFVDLASRFMLVLLLGAIIGYIFSASGLQPLTTFNNTDGRPNYVFYTTLTNVYQEDFIRPSGIYDEPGAFSFFICMTAYLREVTGKSRPMTIILLLLGFITFSVMHVIFFLIYILSLRVNLRKVLQLATCLVLLVALLAMLGEGNVIGEKLLSRLELTEEGTIAGDNRSLLLLNAASVLLSVDHAALMGVDSDCTFNVESCVEKFGGMGENLLSPLVNQGIFISWPYYLFLLAGLFSLARGKRGLLFFAVVLLFVQRPYLLNIGYAVLGVMAFSLHFCSLTSFPLKRSKIFYRKYSFRRREV